MNDRPLLVFDFDGVIVDGMAEYWWSAWHACRRLEAAPEGFPPDQVPDAFRQLRPWVHHGWEMVLLAAELPVLNLRRFGWSPMGSSRPRHCNGVDGGRSSCRRPSMTPAAQAVQQNRSAWLALHRPFPGVVERLQCSEGGGGLVCV